VFFSDEAWFTCSWNVNSENSRYGVPKIPCSLRSSFDLVCRECAQQRSVCVFGRNGACDSNFRVKANWYSRLEFVCLLSVGHIEGQMFYEQSIASGRGRGGREEQTLLEEKLLTGIFQIKSSRRVSRNNFRTCEVCLGAGRRFFWTLKIHGKRNLKSPADASFAVGKASMTAAVPRDIVCGKLCTVCTIYMLWLVILPAVILSLCAM